MCLLAKYLEDEPNARTGVNLEASPFIFSTSWGHYQTQPKWNTQLWLAKHAPRRVEVCLKGRGCQTHLPKQIKHELADFQVSRLVNLWHVNKLMGWLGTGTQRVVHSLHVCCAFFSFCCFCVWIKCYASLAVFFPWCLHVQSCRCVFTYRELHLGSSPEIPQLLWNRKSAGLQTKTLTVCFFSSFPLPSQWAISHHQLPLEHCGVGEVLLDMCVCAFVCKCVCVCVCVCVRLLTQAEGQKHPEVERGCSILWFIFISRPYLIGVSSYSFTDCCARTHTHTHTHTHTVLCKHICTASPKSED